MYLYTYTYLYIYRSIDLYSILRRYVVRGTSHAVTHASQAVLLYAPSKQDYDRPKPRPKHELRPTAAAANRGAN